MITNVTNFPATQAISGSVAAYVQNWPGIMGVSGSLSVIPVYTNTPQGVSGTVQVWSEGALPVSGNVGAFVQNWPATLGVSASIPLQVWSEGAFGVSGSVSITSLPQVSVDNFPATQNVSGTVTANVTFPANQQVWIAQTQGISGSVSILSLPQVSVDNFPATQAVSGTVTAAAFIQNWPATLGVSGSLAVTPVYTNTPQGVSGSPGGYPVRTFDAGTQGVSGTVQAAAFIQNWPALMGVSGSLAVTPVYSNTPQGVSGTVQVWSEGPLPVSGTVTVGNSQALTVVQPGAVSELNVIPMTVSLTGTFSASNGSLVPMVSDVSGNLSIREQFAPVSEDNFNGVIAVSHLPVTASQYAWSVSFSTALASASQVKVTNGVLRSVSGRLDASATAGNYFIKVLNTVTGVSSGENMTYDLIAPLKLVHVSGIDNFFSMDFTEGVFFSAGCQVAASTTEFTYTAAGAFLAVTVEYK